MMIQEFIDRTNYTPPAGEYYHIEKAYYDFPGNKDEFCNWWKKAKRAGYWDRELELRRDLDAEKRERADTVADLSDTLNFYRDCHRRLQVSEQVLQLVAMDFPCDISIWRKDGSRCRYHDIRVKYIPKSYNGRFDFINVIEKGGYIQSIKMADIDYIFT